MAEKKAPSEGKSPAASRSKAAKTADKMEGSEPAEVKKTAAGAKSSPAKAASAKPSGAKSARSKPAAAAKTDAPKTTSSTRPKDASPSESLSGNAQTSDPVRSTIPPSGAKTAASTSTDQAADATKTPDAKTDQPKQADTEKPPASPFENKTTAPAVSAPDKPAADTAGKPKTASPDTAKPAGSGSTTTTAPAQTKTVQAPPRKGGFFALLLGGVCAAAIGFGAAYYILPQMGIMSLNGTASDDIAARFAEQSEQMAALDARIDALPAAPDTSAMEAGQSDMATQIADLSEQLAALTNRLGDIEEQPTGQGGEAVTTGQLTELRRTIKAQGEQIEQLVSNATQRDNAARSAAQQDLRRAALTRIRTALDTGAPFAPALGDLERAGMAAPDALQDVAEVGVPTQTDLQQSFAPAARAALAKARRSGDEDGNAGFWSFMSGQLGARSLERREGPGTDAVLSRAEDDLRQGDLNAALTEVETLPDPAAGELAEWAASARTRMDAIAAYDALAAKLN